MPVWVAVLLVVLSACGARGASRSADSRIGAGANASSSLPVPPSPTRIYPLVVAAGEDVVVVGGYEVVNDRPDRQLGGFEVLHAGAPSWSTLNGGPSPAPLVFPGAVWTGEEVLVAGTPCDEAPPAEDDSAPFCSDRKVELMSIDTKTGRVRALPAPGAPSAFNLRRPPEIAGLGWTGSEAVFQFAGTTEVRFLLYDPKAARWLVAPAPPAGDPFAPVAVCVAGSSVWMVRIPGGAGPSVGVTLGPIKMWRLDPREGRWVALPDRRVGGIAPARAVPQCANGEIVVVSEAVGALAASLSWFDPATESWSETPPLKIPPLLEASLFHMTPMRVAGARIVWPGGDSQRYFVLGSSATEWVARATPPGLGRSPSARPFGDRVLVSSAVLGAREGALKSVDPLEGLAAP